LECVHPAIHSCKIQCVQGKDHGQAFSRNGSLNLFRISGTDPTRLVQQAGFLDTSSPGSPIRPPESNGNTLISSTHFTSSQLGQPHRFPDQFTTQVDGNDVCRLFEQYCDRSLRSVPGDGRLVRVSRASPERVDRNSTLQYPGPVDRCDPQTGPQRNCKNFVEGFPSFRKISAGRPSQSSASLFLLDLLKASQLIAQYQDCGPVIQAFYRRLRCGP